MHVFYAQDLVSDSSRCAQKYNVILEGLVFGHPTATVDPLTCAPTMLFLAYLLDAVVVAQSWRCGMISVRAVAYLFQAPAVVLSEIRLEMMRGSRITAGYHNIMGLSSERGATTGLSVGRGHGHG